MPWGQHEHGVIVVKHFVPLVPDEKIRLNSERLATLYRQLGEAGAEDIICRAVEELAVRLAYCEKLWRLNDLQALHKSARSLVAISDQIGMVCLAQVATDVANCSASGDPVATSATLSRLIRIGERSLTAVWELQDLSV